MNEKITPFVPESLPPLEAAAPLVSADYGSVLISRQNEITYGLVVTTEVYNCRTNDRYIIASGGTSYSVFLPEAKSGKVITVKRTASGNIIINGNGKNIDSAATKTLSAVYNCVVLVYNGSEWSIVSEI